MPHPSWKEIWERKGREGLTDRFRGDDSPLAHLLALNGYSSGLVSPSVADWNGYVGEIARRLDLSAAESVYEVGCGCGAFLYPLAGLGCRIAGLDYSPSLIEVARKALPQGDFAVGEALRLDPAESFDVVLSSGVFLYFPNLDYARETLERMVAKAVRAVAILDVNDLGLQAEALELRRASFPPGEYEAHYAGLEQLYFAKSWFTEWAEERGLRSILEPQFMPRSTNSRYRYNVYLFKERATARRCDS